MSTKKLSELKTMWLGLSLYYRQQLNKDQVRMYAEDLQDLELSDVGRAIQSLRQDPTQKFLPMPSQVREKIIGNANEDAQDSASRILEAIARFGYTNISDAQNYIGELGWAVVVREGGWQSICERTKSDDIPILKAQWREMAKVFRAKSNRGNFLNPPKLLTDYKKDNDKSLGHIGSIFIEELNK